MSIPKVGQEIYVPSQLYMSRGKDDFAGGKATIASVKETINGGEPDYLIAIKERPGHGYYWRFLETKQEEHKKNYGDQIAHPDPDNRPEFNCWATPGDTVTETRRDEDGNWVTITRKVTRYEP